MFSPFVFQNKTKKIISNLLCAKDDDNLCKNLSLIQSEIAVKAEAKVIGIMSLENDLLSAAFAKAFSDIYNKNNSSTLIIDANLYNPCFKKITDVYCNDSHSFEVDLGFENKDVFVKNNLSKTVFLETSAFPSESLKQKQVQKIISENKNYDHAIVIVPSLYNHKDVVLLSDVLDSLIIVVQRNATKRSDLFYAIQFCEDNLLPLAQTIIIK